MKEEKKEANQRQKIDSGKKAAIISVLATLAVILVICSAYWAWKKYSASQKDLAALKAQMENLQKSPEAVSGEASAVAEAAGTKTVETGEYAGWEN